MELQKENPCFRGGTMSFYSLQRPGNSRDVHRYRPTTKRSAPLFQGMPWSEGALDRPPFFEGRVSNDVGRSWDYDPVKKMKTDRIPAEVMARASFFSEWRGRYILER